MTDDSPTTRQTLAVMARDTGRILATSARAAAVLAAVGALVYGLGLGIDLFASSTLPSWKITGNIHIGRGVFGALSLCFVAMLYIALEDWMRSARKRASEDGTDAE